MQNEPQFILYRAQRTNGDIQEFSIHRLSSLHTYNMCYEEHKNEQQTTIFTLQRIQINQMHIRYYTIEKHTLRDTNVRMKLTLFHSIIYNLKHRYSLLS